jgi:rhodanese-related sulfurtransferase
MLAQVTPAQLSAWCAAAPTGVTPVVLDVREAWELATASVSGSAFELLHIPMGQLMARMDDLPKDRPIACLCHHGIRSRQVAMYLLQQGYAHTVNIAGGTDAWSSFDPSLPRY